MLPVPFLSLFSVPRFSGSKPLPAYLVKFSITLCRFPSLSAHFLIPVHVEKLAWNLILPLFRSLAHAPIFLFSGQTEIYIVLYGSRWWSDIPQSTNSFLSLLINSITLCLNHLGSSGHGDCSSLYLKKEKKKTYLQHLLINLELLAADDRLVRMGNLSLDAWKTCAKVWNSIWTDNVIMHWIYLSAII